MEVVRAEEREPFVTRDGSTVREIAGPAPGNASNQSLAEATVPPGGETIEHLHRASEEISRFTSGSGRMRLGEPLVVLCSCAPPYSHEDTVLCE